MNTLFQILSLTYYQNIMRSKIICFNWLIIFEIGSMLLLFIKKSVFYHQSSSQLPQATLSIKGAPGGVGASSCQKSEYRDLPATCDHLVIISTPPKVDVQLSNLEWWKGRLQATRQHLCWRFQTQFQRRETNVKGRLFRILNVANLSEDFFDVLHSVNLSEVLYSASDTLWWLSRLHTDFPLDSEMAL